MGLTVNAKAYGGDGFTSNAVTYIGPLKTVTVRDEIVLRRNGQVATPDYSGNSHTSAKLTRTLTLTGALSPTGLASLEIKVAIPVGAASADVDSILNDMGSFLSSATFKTHVKTPAVSF